MRTRSEGVKKSENFVGIIIGSPLFEQRTLFQTKLGEAKVISAPDCEGVRKRD